MANISKNADGNWEVNLASAIATDRAKPVPTKQTILETNESYLDADMVVKHAEVQGAVQDDLIVSVEAINNLLYDDEAAAGDGALSIEISALHDLTQISNNTSWTINAGYIADANKPSIKIEGGASVTKYVKCFNGTPTEEIIDLSD